MHIRFYLRGLVGICIFWAMSVCANAQGEFKQLLDYSRPGKYHQLLADLAGKWTFTGKHYSGNANPDSNRVVVQFGGSLVRGSFANGRFFQVEMTGGKLSIPIQDGKMLETEYKEMQTEGYDNVKKRFVLTVINNHIGSDIEYLEGVYNESTRTIAYQGEVELLPGKKEKAEVYFIFQDKDHYRLEYFEDRDGHKVKVHEVICVRKVN